MTELLYLQDAYLTTCQTRVERVSELGIVLEQTIFYPPVQFFPVGPDGFRRVLACYQLIDFFSDRFLVDRVLHVKIEPASSFTDGATGDAVG